MDIGRKLAELEARLARMEASPRLSHAAIDNTSLEVRDSNGALRGLVGVQADGTTAVNIVNGPPPPQPTAPIVTSVLGGVTASWDGQFTDGSPAPLDWQRIEVHASIASGFTPTPATLRATVETPQGSTVVVTTDDPVYVRLLARNTSGAASAPSDQAGPFGPTPVVADELLDGIVTTSKLAAGAVTINALTESLADTASQRYVDAMGDSQAWTVLQKSPNGTLSFLTGVSDARTGDTVAQATGFHVIRGTVQIPYDPEVLYRVSVRVRTTAASASGNDTLYLGVLGIAADGVTLVNRTGAASYFSQHQAASNGASQPIAFGWVTYTGYLMGRAASGTATSSPDPRTPGVVHDNVRFIAPLMFLNFGSGTTGDTGTMQVDAFTIEALKTGVVGSSNLVAGSVTTAALAADSVTATKILAGSVEAAKIATGAVTTEKLDALAVTADKLAANSVIAGKIAAGAVSTNQLTVGIAQSIVTKLTDAMGDATAWTMTVGSGTWGVLTNVADAAAGGTVIEATGPVSLERADNIPYDPDALYKVTARVRTTVAPSAGSPVVSIGLVGVAADGTTKVSSTGAPNSVTGQHYIAAAGVTVAVGTAWTTFTGYVQGTAATGTTTACPDPKAPGRMHTNVRYVRPSVRLLTGATGGTQQIDQVTVETVPTGVVNSVNIADGAITAAKIAADAITGKTITGGLIQTATSGERITLNEAAQNKVIVYNTSGVAIGELSARGLLVAGTTGAVIWANPDAPLPQLRFDNASDTNQAYIQMAEVNPGDANLQLVSGTFTADTFTDRTWRHYMGNDFLVLERIRRSSSTAHRGGRVNLRAGFAEIGYMNSTAAADAGYSYYQPGLVTTKGRHRIEPVAASADSLLYLEAAAGHTGPAIRYWDPDAAVFRFVVDKAGNADVNGILTAGNIAAGRLTITPSAANTPTSQAVTGLNLKGTNIRVVASAATTVPGTQVLGVGVTNQSATGFTVWVTRTNTTATVIEWIAYGV